MQLKFTEDTDRQDVDPMEVEEIEGFVAENEKETENDEMIGEGNLADENDTEAADEDEMEAIEGPEIEAAEENYETDENDFEDDPDQPTNTAPNDSEQATTSKEPAPRKFKPLAPLRAINLPLAKVKNIMKLDPDVNLASHEAIALVAKATEMFIQALAKESCRVKDPKKKTIQKRDFDFAITQVESLEFLDGAMHW